MTYKFKKIDLLSLKFSICHSHHMWKYYETFEHFLNHKQGSKNEIASHFHMLELFKDRLVNIFIKLEEIKKGQGYQGEWKNWYKNKQGDPLSCLGMALKSMIQINNTPAEPLQTPCLSDPIITVTLMVDIILATPGAANNILKTGISPKRALLRERGKRQSTDKFSNN